MGVTVHSSLLLNLSTCGKWLMHWVVARMNIRAEILPRQAQLFLRLLCGLVSCSRCLAIWQRNGSVGTSALPKARDSGRSLLRAQHPTGGQSAHFVLLWTFLAS